MHTLLLFATCLKIRWTVMNIPTASMKCVFTLPVLLFALFAFPGLCTAQGSVANDKSALQALYNATDGDNWNSNTNWNSTEPLHQWHGVRVDSRTGRVTIIGLANNNLNGSIPVEIGDLTALERILLSGNTLTGEIPSSIGDLTALEKLSLYNNALTGEIPSSIGDLTALESLHLSYNDLTGGIPSSIVDLTALKVLSLYNNTLTGEIPSSIGDLTALEELWLTDNDLTGGIPSSIVDLTALKVLSLYNNTLTGEIPSSIGDLTALEELWLTDNDLTGGIPSSIGDLTALESLLLSSNDLTGEIPSSIGDLTALENLHLNDNALTGEIPESFSNLVNLSTFYAGGTNNVCIPLGLQSWHNGISQRDSLPECASSPPSPTVSVTPETLSVTEGAGSAQLTLELSEVHSDPVTVDWATSDGTATAGSDYTAGDGTVNFAPNETRKTIDIAITDDALDESDETFTVTLSSPSNAELGVAKTTTVTIADNDVRGVAISPTTLTITEGAGKTYEVVLNTQPTGDVTVTPSLATGSDADVTLASSAVLTFTMLNWNVAREVTVSAAEDTDTANGAATIEHSASGADYGSVSASSVTATEADNDAAGVTVTPTALAVPEGSNAKYTVVLDAQPSADVTIAVLLAAGSDTDITVNKTSLTFTTDNWSTAQEVTVSAAEDDDAINGAATIEHSASGADYGGVSVSSVTATESDNDTAGVTVTPTALAVPEGSNAKYTVALDARPSADVTVAVSLASGSDADITLNTSSLVFTSDNWATAQDVWVKAAEDDDALNGEATIEHAVSGADYGSVTASSVTATESDNDTANVTVAPTSVTVAEGDSVKYTVVLATKPSGDVTVAALVASGSDADITLGSAEALVFTSDNWATAQDVWVKAAEDDDALNGVATIEHSASGADYGSVSASSVTATEADNDAAGVTVTPTALAVPEGSNAKYTVVLDAQPSADVTIAVLLAAGSDTDITVNKTSLTFTTDNWSTAQEVTVSAAEDDDAINGAATIEHSASGADYGGVSVSSVTATESDNDTAGVTVTPTALAVPEGSNAKYTVALDARPSADVTVAVSLASGSDADITLNTSSLVFTSDNWATAQDVWVKAAEDDDALNGEATIEHAVSGADYGSVTASSVTATESDNDTANVTVAPTSVTVAEGDSVKYTVVLATKPSGDVTVAALVASGSDADITLGSAEALVFTSDNWATAQDVWVKAAEDDDALNGVATIEHSASGADYGSVSASSVTATESDNDAAGVTVTPTALTVAEGDSVKYTVVLTTEPSNNVTIAVLLAAGSDTDITVDKTSLTFTTDNWSTTQEVTVSAAEDSDTANGAATIGHSASGGGYGGVSVSSVTATESDNDTAGVTVTPTALAITEGSNAKYTVALNTQPSADVTISVSLAAGSDADITVDKTSLTFTTDNWNVAREVTVSAAEDTDTANGAATIEHSASGADYGSVSASSVTATEADNDAAGVTVTPTALAVPEGSNAKYTVVLDAQPSADVTIAVLLAAGSDTDITVDKTSLTFTTDNWSTAQEVTVSAAEDDDAINGAATIEHSASGADYGGVSVSSVTATESDNDTAGVTVTPTALAVPEGSNAKYTVALDARPSADVTVAVSLASGSDADITLNTSSLVFTSDNWATAQDVWVKAAEDDDALNGEATIEHAVSGADYGSVTASSVTATESDNDTANVTVAPTSVTVAEGDSVKYTVVLATKPSGDVTVAALVASGSDADITVNTTSLTFTPDDWSVAQQVTVMAAEDADREDDAAVLNHKASGGDYGEVTIAAVVVTVTDVIGGVDVSGWLARYSRVGAGHLLSSLENRMERLDRVSSDAEVSIAGQRIVFGDSPARPGMELSGASAIWSASQSYTTSSLDGRRSVGLMKPFGMTSGLNAAASRYTNMTLRDALSRSAFRYARETSTGNSFGVWGQGSFSRFSGSESGADMDGDVMSGTVGVDNSFSGWLHGIAVSRSESEGTYRIAGEDSLSLSASLTGIYPYMRYNLTDRLRVWSTGGYGRGSLRLQGDSLASSSSDLSMALGSIGVSGDIVSASSQGFGLSWQTDAMLVRSSLASSRSLSSVEAIVHRLRLSLESSYTLKMGDRAYLAPKLQLGVRRDGGDAEQGMGLDVAGGLGFVNSAWGLRAQVDMHGMLVHEDSDFEQWGISGMILFNRSPSLDIGASLRLFPSWGSASSSTGGMRALWSRETVSGLGGFRRTGGDDRSLRLAGRFDYGFAAFGKSGVTTPYASFSLSGNEARGTVADTGVELGGGLGYSNRSLGLRMRAGMRGLISEEEVGFEQWGASGTIAFDPDPSSPLGASFNVSQSWGITPRIGFGGSQNMGTMREREPLPRSVTGMSRPNLYGQPMRIEGEMGYGFSAPDGDGVATPYAGVVFSDRGRSGLLLGFNLQTSKRFLLNLESSTPDNGKITLNSVPEFRVRGLMKW